MAAANTVSAPAPTAAPATPNPTPAPTAAPAQASADASQVPTTTDPALAQNAPRKRAPKNPENELNIINGRLPLPLVYAIRFKEAGKPVAEVAKAYGTSIGKVFDINKNRNFAYIGQDYKPSKDEMDAANAWITSSKTRKGQTLKEAGGDPDRVGAHLKTFTVATPDEVAKRNWAVRQVGQAASNQAPTAPTGPTGAPAPNLAAGQGASPNPGAELAKPAGAKLF